MAGLGLVVTWAGYLLVWYGFYGLVKGRPVTLRQAASLSQRGNALAAIAPAPTSGPNPNAAQIAAAQAAATSGPPPVYRVPTSTSRSPGAA